MALKSVIIGLTGGVGSGKTYVARIFRSLGSGIIDADKIAHRIIDAPVIRRALIKWQGRNILDRKGMINRRSLAQFVFSDPGRVLKLNRLTHPYIRREILQKIKNSPERIIVIDAPLLLESHLDKLCDYLVFIQAPFKLRRKRVLDGRGWDGAELRKRERFQLPVGRKRRRADFVVDNSSAIRTLSQVKRIFKAVVKDS